MSAEEKKGVIILYKYEEPLKMLSPEEQAKILMASIAYDKTGEVPELDSPMTKMLWALMVQDFDSMKESWEAKKKNNKERAKAGANKRWDKEENMGVDENAKNASSITSIDENAKNATSISSIKENANDALYGYGYDSDSVNEKDNTNPPNPPQAVGSEPRADSPREDFELDGDELFEKMYERYPRKSGKADGKISYISYLTDGKEIKGQGKIRFNHYQVLLACYVFSQKMAADERPEDKIPYFSTFMNGELLDYAEQTKQQYESSMLQKYGDNWHEIKFKYNFAGINPRKKRSCLRQAGRS